MCIRICSSSPFRGIFYLCRLVTPGYCIFDFGGNTGVLALAPPPPDQSLRWIFWNAAELPAVSFFEARVL